MRNLTCTRSKNTRRQLSEVSTDLSYKQHISLTWLVPTPDSAQFHLNMLLKYLNQGLSSKTFARLPSMLNFRALAKCPMIHATLLKYMQWWRLIVHLSTGAISSNHHDSELWRLNLCCLTELTEACLPSDTEPVYNVLRHWSISCPVFWPANEIGRYKTGDLTSGFLPEKFKLASITISWLWSNVLFTRNTLCISNYPKLCCFWFSSCTLAESISFLLLQHFHHPTHTPFILFTGTVVFKSLPSHLRAIPRLPLWLSWWNLINNMQLISIAPWALMTTVTAVRSIGWLIL